MSSPARPTAAESTGDDKLIDFHLSLSFICRRYGTKCGGCGQGLAPSDLVRKARDKVFHLNCFTCCICRKQLSTGEQLHVLDDNKFICKDDYLLGKGHHNSLTGESSLWPPEASQMEQKLRRSEFKIPLQGFRGERNSQRKWRYGAAAVNSMRIFIYLYTSRVHDDRHPRLLYMSSRNDERRIRSL